MMSAGDIDSLQLYGEPEECLLHIHVQAEIQIALSEAWAQESLGGVEAICD